MTRPKEVAPLTLTLLLIAAVASSALLSVIPPAKAAPAEPLRLGVYRGLHSALIYVADTQGFFKKRGIDLTLKEYEAGVLAVDDLVAGNVDIATGGEFVFVMQAFRQPDLRMTAAICMASDQTLVIRKDRGISGPQDLKGRRVAVVRGSQSEFFLYNYLIVNRFSPQSVHPTYYTPSNMVEAITEGKIDAAVSWPPYTIEMAKRLGANGARWPAQSGQDYYFTLLAREGFLKKQPERIEQFLAALSEAEQFMGKYQDRTQSILRARLQVDAEVFHETWPCLRPQLRLTQDLLVLMEREARWAIRKKLVEQKEMPNYLDFFYFDALEKVKPGAISIVH